MQVVYHLGAHCTESDRLVKCLLKNRGVLAREGTVVAGPTRFRQVLRDALQNLNGQPASAEAQEVLLDAIMDEDEAERLILSNDNFLSVPGGAIEGSYIYPRAADKCLALRRLFPTEPAEFHISIRNPATFLPQLFGKPKGPDPEVTMSLMDPEELRWSNTIRAIRRACPDAPVTVWCDEDAPLIWEDVMRDVAGVGPEVPLEGNLDLASALLSKEGFDKLRGALSGVSEPGKRHRIIGQHLEEFALPDALDLEVDLNGWSESFIDILTEAYDVDVERIASLPGVDLIRP